MNPNQYACEAIAFNRTKRVDFTYGDDYRNYFF